MALRLVTWNCNSVRLREELLARLVEHEAPDVICLQETKVENDKFPCGMFEAHGYTHQLLNGIRAYHGTAILSRRPIELSGQRDWCDRIDGRHAWAVIDGIEIHNYYVPAGGDIPDPEVNDKFAHKLNFLRDLTEWWTELARNAPEAKRVLVGDLNVAPLENDVWSHKQMLKVVSHTPVEVAHLNALQASHGWVDAVRRFVPPEEKLYTWWSYRARDWEKSDRGRRLDHIWVTPALSESLIDARVLRQARGWARPSDHVPVVLDLDTDAA